MKTVTLWARADLDGGTTTLTFYVRDDGQWEAEAKTQHSYVRFASEIIARGVSDLDVAADWLIPFVRAWATRNGAPTVR